MRAFYYDTETTGVKAGRDRIIEIAAYDPEENKSFSTFSNPQIPIPPEATAISGITDAMVAGAPPIEEALAAFFVFCPPGTVLIAHNNDAFDRLFLEAECQRGGLVCPHWHFIDTLKWSRKYRSDLPRHGLQYLREVYGIPPNQAHRALDDCKVLHGIFTQMIDDLSWEAVLSLLFQNREMPFGKYAGRHLTEVPKDYRSWLFSSGTLDKPGNSGLKESLEKLDLPV
jgi:DNA polymerase III subunit epsilon